MITTRFSIFHNVGVSYAIMHSVQYTIDRSCLECAHIEIEALPSVLSFLSTLKRRGYPTCYCSERATGILILGYRRPWPHWLRYGLELVPFALDLGRFEIGVLKQLGFWSLDLIVVVFSETRHFDSGWQSHLCLQPAVTEETYASLDLTQKTIKGCLKVFSHKTRPPHAIQPKPTTKIT